MFLVPIARAKEANAFMARQGYGQGMFGVEVGPANEGKKARTLVGCLQPTDPAMQAALRLCVGQLGGDELAIELIADPIETRRRVVAALLKSKLEIKGRSDAARLSK